MNLTESWSHAVELERQGRQEVPWKMYPESGLAFSCVHCHSNLANLLRAVYVRVYVRAEVRDLKLKLDQSDMSKVTQVWHKVTPQFILLQIIGHYEVP